MLDRRSALQGVLKDETVLGADRRARLVIGERRGFTLVQVAAFAATLDAVEAVLTEALDAEPPVSAAAPVRADRATVFKTGHAQFWIMGNSDAGPSVPPIAADIGAVTDLGHSRTCIFLAGDAAIATLKKGFPLDFSDTAFPPGAAALTGVHHVPVLLYRAGDDRFELLVLRTFAGAVWEWLTDAALEFGYRIETATAGTQARKLGSSNAASD